MRDDETAQFRARLMTASQFNGSKKMPSESKWKKVRELIMRWAQDDGTGDELQDLVTNARESGMNDAEWAEFETRLKKAFG